MHSASELVFLKTIFCKLYGFYEKVDYLCMYLETPRRQQTLDKSPYACKALPASQTPWKTGKAAKTERKLLNVERKAELNLSKNT